MKQEVIASEAGWLAISAGNFDKTRDRVGISSTTLQLVDLPELTIRVNDTMRSPNPLAENNSDIGRTK